MSSKRQQEQQMNIKTSVRRILSVKKDIYAYMQHTCDNSFCNPENEAVFIAKRLLIGPPVEPDVYVCKYGGLHYCTKDTCNLYTNEINDGICPITGAKYVQPVSYFLRNPNSSLRVTDPKIKPRAYDPNHSQQVLSNATTGGGGGVKRKSIYQQLFNRDGDGDGGSKGEVVVAVKKKKQKRRRNRLANNRSVFIEKAQSLVNTLLFSTKRKEINERKQRESVESGKCRLKLYLQQCKAKRQFPIVIEELTIQINAYLMPPHLEIFEYDEEKTTYYTSIIMKTWDLLCSSPYGRDNQSCKFKQHALGVLYLLRQGFTCHGIRVLPKDPFMIYLPLRTELGEFGNEIVKKHVTVGQTHLRNMYESIIQEGWPLEKFVLFDCE